MFRLRSYVHEGMSRFFKVLTSSYISTKKVSSKELIIEFFAASVIIRAFSIIKSSLDATESSDAFRVCSVPWVGNDFARLYKVHAFSDHRVMQLHMDASSFLHDPISETFWSNLWNLPSCQ